MNKEYEQITKRNKKLDRTLSKEYEFDFGRLHRRYG